MAGRLQPAGFKILFDLIASQAEPLRIAELPYAFQAREAGESKMDGRVALEYLGLVASKLSGDLISPRMVFFGLVGLSGVLVHMAVLWGAQRNGGAVRLRPGARRGHGHDLQLPHQQRRHLPRPAAEGLAAGRPAICVSARSARSAWSANVAVGGRAAGARRAVGRWRASSAPACGAIWNYVSTYLGVW